MAYKPRLLIVSAAHISAGRPRKSLSCPIALALKTVCPKAEFITVGAFTAKVDGQVFALEDKARTFIDRFDHGEPVKPFSFRIPDNLCV